MTTQVYIGIGSNLEVPESQVGQAITALSSIPQTTLLAVSPLYQSKPIGPGDQADYLNGVAALSTTLDSHALLDALQSIENQQGRVRVERWGPRTLDLDILLFGNETINSERLTVPHPFLTERNFVVCPLYDLAPLLTLPNGQKLNDIQANIAKVGLDRIS